MIPELGYFALILALALAMVQSVLPLVGASLGWSRWMATARPAALGQWVFLVLAFGCLTHAFVYNDFSVFYVSQHSNSSLPLVYRISAVWGGHEGSLLLWVLLLATWSVAVAWFSRSLSRQMVARVLGVMGVISIGFLLFMILTSNPFDRIFPAPLDGKDLNPLLQDPGLIIHPPMLYMGYVGFSVAFAFAIAALLNGNLDSAWARWSRPWTAIAWMFLTLGIVLGSWWAYYELGWGGWWFWDPVENASFMPWLVGTALMHSLAVTEKRGAFKNWTVLLAITTFSLSLLGTFLVRSGVLTSVHAFATDPERGSFILGFLAAVVIVSLTLYAWRAPRVGKGGSFDLVSRETLLLGNNILLMVAAGSVLLGTLYPLFLDAMNLGKISVGPPYFGTVFFWLMVPLIFLLGLGPLARWQRQNPGQLLRNTWVLGLISLALGILIPLFLMDNHGLAVILGLAGAFWITLTLLRDIYAKLRHKTGLIAGLSGLPGAFYAMTLAHLGVAVFLVGVTLSNASSVEKDVRMEVGGEGVNIGTYQFNMKKIERVEGPNYLATRGTVEVTRDGDLITVLHPEKRDYHSQTMPMTEAAIDWGFTRDIYVAMGEPVSRDAWAVRVYYKPFIRWIWIGGLLMALGGLWAALDKRYRRLAQIAHKKPMASPKATPELATKPA